MTADEERDDADDDHVQEDRDPALSRDAHRDRRDLRGVLPADPRRTLAVAGGRRLLATDAAQRSGRVLPGRADATAPRGAAAGGGAAAGRGARVPRAPGRRLRSDGRDGLL